MIIRLWIVYGKINCQRRLRRALASIRLVDPQQQGTRWIKQRIGEDMRHADAPRNLLGSSDFLRFHQISSDFLKFFRFHQISSDFIRFHQISSDFIRFHQISSRHFCSDLNTVPTVPIKKRQLRCSMFPIICDGQMVFHDLSVQELTVIQLSTPKWLLGRCSCRH